MSEKKLFRDPLYGYIEVSECAFKLINNPFFQRLRRIKQLGFSEWVYHGAEHSRFGHSLGVYHLARKISDSLLSKEKDENIKEEFMLAALLHDIGHHPRSHSFESVLNSLFSSSSKSYDHEDYTLKIIQDTEIGDIIEKLGFSKQHVIQLIQGGYTEKSHLQYLNGLISSQFDIDRIDYLLRDSFYCGVPYGKIDLDRLFYSLEPKEDSIIITEKGLQSIEMYVLSRFYMYTQVYTHKTTRAFDLMLMKLIDKEHFDSYGYPHPSGDIEQFIDFDDYWLWNKLKELSLENSFKYKELAKNMILRKPIKCVIEQQDLTEIGTNSQDKFYTEISLLKSNNLLYTESGIENEYIFVDEPWKKLPIYSPYYLIAPPNKDEGDYNPILIRTKTGDIDIALLPYSIAYRIAKHQAKVIRMYTIPEKRKQLSETIRSIQPELSSLIWKKE
jgi:uncharacterized protein